MVQRMSFMKWLGVFVGLIVIAFLFRSPFLINAPLMDSDFSFLYLQALEFLNGHISYFLWGSTYQASFEPLLAAGLFSIFGDSVWAFIAVPLSAYVLGVGLIVSLLGKRLSSGATFVATLCVVFATTSFVVINIYPHRQWSITTMLLSVWLADRAMSSPRRGLHFGVATFLVFLACYFDFYVISFVVPTLAYAVFCAWDGGVPRKELIARLKPAAIGFLIGGFCLIGTRFLGAGGGAPLAFSPKTFVNNYDLLFLGCIPRLFGIPTANQPLGQILSSQPIYALVLLAGYLFILSQLVGGWVAFRRKNLPWSVRKIGLFGALVVLNTIAGFLGSSMAVDIYSERYLPPILWAAPFSLTPLAYIWGTKVFSYRLVPYLATMALSAWVSFTPYVQDFMPRKDPLGTLSDEIALGEYLRNRGIHHGETDYWVAYRLSAVHRKDPLIVPRQRWIDRFKLYREAVDAAPVIADIFGPRELPDALSNELKRLEAEGIAFERVQIGRFTVLIEDHRAGSALSLN